MTLTRIADILEIAANLPKRDGDMKRALIVVGVILVLLVLAAVIVPFLIPTSVYKAQIEKAATNATGREVVLTGDPSLSIFPSISVKIDGASVSNPEGFSTEHLLTAGEFKANVKLWPLFSSRVEIAQITLSDATVNLERLATGEANWEFTPSGEVAEPAPEVPDQDAAPAAPPSFETNIARARLRNANIYYSDATTDTQYAVTEVDIEARLTALNAPLVSSGSGRLNGQAFAYEIDLDTIEDVMLARPASLIASLETDYGTVTYDGAVTVGETPSVDGGFSLKSQTLNQLIAFFGADLPVRADALKQVDIEGRVSGPVTALLIDLAKTDLRAEGLEIDYQGTVELNETPSLDGRLDVRADNPGQLLKPDAQIAALSIINDLDLSADLSGPSDSLSLDNVNLTHRGPLIDADYTGRLSLGGQGALNGRLSANSDDLRGLLGALDVEVPDGDRLRSFSIQGNTSGSFEGFSLADATLNLDDLSATGKLGADISGARPKLSADLSMPRLDLTPFLGAGEAPAQTMEDWDDTPLALDTLQMLDANLTLNAGEVVINDITLQDALLVTTLNNGVLSAIFRRADNQPGFRAFDGAWAGDMTINASTATPSMSVDATAEGVAAQKLFEAFTGFNRLDGIGRVELDMSSEGNSLKGLINGLDGDFETALDDGVLRGINLSQFIQSADNLTALLSSGDLSLASFRGAVSETAETEFTEFLGDLKFTNGVAAIENLELRNPVVGVIGDGSINLADRTIDITLKPRIDRGAQGQGNTIGLSGIAVPVRISGSWTNLSYGFDTQAVQQELTARARGRVADEITNRVEGPLGGLLGEVVGGGRGNQTQPSQEEPEAEQSIEDEVRDRVLDGLFGRDDDGE